jgi:2,3-bisphosphoglycerate-independent phosphoglycerate mutase
MPRPWYIQRTMNRPVLPDDLVLRGRGGRILLVVLDGVGGLPHPETGRTELETARTPTLDALASRSSLGMLTPVAPGITPGSGPGHLALFGYDPVEYTVGRGALSALGVGFELEPGDLAVRLNLATLDDQGRVLDRRAGRPPDDEARRAVAQLASEVAVPEGTRLFVEHEKEHRAVLVLRGDGLDARIRETDPQRTGVPPHEPEALTPEAEATARVLAQVLDSFREILRDGDRITGVLARGFARYEPLPSMRERFGVEGSVVARYPMYRGVARLVGMQVPGEPSSDEGAVELLEGSFDGADFHFLHYKTPDARGEDGDFQAKVEALEAADEWMGRLAALEPDVLIVTGDHSTPAAMAAHSWHSVPVLIRSRWARPTGQRFGESTCRAGDLGHLETRHLMSLALAHAGRLAKFGA